MAVMKCIIPNIGNFLKKPIMGYDLNALMFHKNNHFDTSSKIHSKN